MDFSSAWLPLHLMYSKGYKISPFDISYNSSVMGVGAIDANAGIVNVASDCISLLLGWTHLSSPAFAAAVVPQCVDFTMTIQVQDRDIFSGPINSHLNGRPIHYNVLANSQLRQPGGSLLQFPYTLKPGGTIRIAIVNGGVAANIVRLNLHTVKLFPRKSPESKPYQTAIDDYIGE